MKQVIDNILQRQFHNMPVPSYSRVKRRSIINPVSIILLIIIISSLLTGLVLAQELTYPDPIYPPNNGTIDIDKITSITFSWKPFFVATNKYAFELATNPEMSPTIVKTTITNGQTTYKYPGKLEYKTTYYWRVMASEPPGGEWGSAIFTTKPASTNNATKSQEPTQKSTQESFPSSIINYLTNKDNLPILGLIAGIVIIVIIALVFLAKPKSRPAGQRQWQGIPPPQMQQPAVCPVCGSPNSPERKFCSNCGTDLASKGPQSPWGIQQPNTCPSCGLPNPPGQRFCYNCGTNLAGGQQPQQQQQEQPQQQKWQVFQTFTCPTCGAPVNKGSNPCPNCRTWMDWGA